MIFTWVKYGKPDVSMTLNGALAGLVAITAGCDLVSPVGAFFIGLLAGIAVVLSVEFFDKVVKIDDPVGAISVHGVCGALGTLLTGLFATEDGLFYGGGVHFFLVQLLGVVSVIAYVAIVMFIIYKVIDKTIGLRVPAEVEIDGLDIHEHGLTSAYSGFAISDATDLTVEENERLNAERKEYERLVNFEKDILATNRKNEVKAVFDKFDERLADVEGYSDLKANYGDMSIEDIEDKCFAMVGKITTKFSTKKKNDSVVKLDFEVSEPDTKDDGYGGILSSRYSN